MLKLLGVKKQNMNALTLTVGHLKCPENQWEDVKLCTEWLRTGVTLFFVVQVHKKCFHLQQKCCPPFKAA